jgi:carbamoyl-phosphate synthase/aspartate carbamoyltransferase/dihydroorotase
MLTLPGLIDTHVHLREPGATHKEDWETGTAAALAGGFTLVLAMPNTSPPIVDADSFRLSEESASRKVHCDYGIYLGATQTNAAAILPLWQRAAGLKMYLDATYGPLLLDDMQIWARHLRFWTKGRPIVAHAERRTLAALLFLAETYQRPVHIAHVSRKEEIWLIREAKARGVPVTCEVTPHHLFLTEKSGSGGKFDVRPRLASQEDVDALWENLDVIDSFATDHAPHTLAEKESETPPPGFPGLETALPLLLTAVHDGRLSLEDLIEKMYTNPRRIFNLPEQVQTWVEVDETAHYELRASEQFTKCGWTPFEGWRVRGRVTRVVLRGKEVFRDGEILSPPGFGYNIRTWQYEEEEELEPGECWL